MDPDRNHGHERAPTEPHAARPSYAGRRAPWACDPAASRGRRHPEPESRFRTAFQRDRDRIIHSSAFRRLKHKTQVFVEHEGDYYRTRLTHSLEVAQVARSLAWVLGLDVDLAEAIALAHDLGHPPFGHTGEEALDAAMRAWGGFDHNAQAIRILTCLERHYAEFDGLNLCWETLEGIAKHNGPVAAPHPVLAEYVAGHDLELGTHAALEAQVAALADDIAYTHHDLQDGLRAGLFTLEELGELPLLAGCLAEVDRRWPGLAETRRRHETLRRFFGLMVEDVIAVSEAELAALAPRSPDDIRAAGRTLVRFSPPTAAAIARIRSFLFRRMYRAPAVVETRRRVARIVSELFAHLMAEPGDLPAEWRAEIAPGPGEEQARARVVCDYIAGMTDRFALAAHERLVGGGGMAPLAGD